MTSMTWMTGMGGMIVMTRFRFRFSLFPSIFSLMLGYRLYRLRENVSIELI